MTAPSISKMSAFADTIYRAKYAQPGEEWEDTARRVATAVMGPYLPGLVDEVTDLITQRKFMPGGRYLYAAGKKMHQVNNCALLTVEDSREGWADLLRRAVSALMTGAGIGVVYTPLRPRNAPVRGMGGTSTGPTATMQMVNEAGRHIMQGGSRRAAMWAGLHWWHADVFEFIALKDWSPEVRALKEKDFNFPATLDMTNISVILDDEFFEAIEDESWTKTYEIAGYSWTVDHQWAQKVYWTVVSNMLTTAEPGFSIDVGVNSGESLRNAPVAGSTRVLTANGYVPVSDIVGEPTAVWTGKQWAPDVVFKETNDKSSTLRVRMTGGRYIDADPTHPFMVERVQGAGTRRRIVSVDRVAAQDLRPGDQIQVSLPKTSEVAWSPSEYTLGWIYGDGSFTAGGGADLTLCSPESQACLPHLSGYHSANPKDGRGFVRLYFSSGRFSGRTKVRVPAQDVTASFIAGLFDADGNWNPQHHVIRLASKHESFLHDVRLGLEALGILSHVSKAGTSTYGQRQGYQLVVAADYAHEFARLIPTKRLNIDLGDYQPYRRSTVKVLSVDPAAVQPVYCADVVVEEHTFVAEGVVISNCNEITSSDDNDVCNLGSLNLAQFDDINDFERAVQVSTAFLLCGTLYSTVPYEEIAVTRAKNRRLGLGLMGFYEWLLVRGKRYGIDSELERWLEVYADASDAAAWIFARELDVSRPVKVRAIAPTGTIGILAETTTGIEPMLAAAYKRRFLRGQTWHFQYVVDSTAQRLLDRGVDPALMEDAYDLAKDPERRLAFQAWVQRYVDHGISSTLNLPSVEDQTFTHQEFGEMLLKYLPHLRGMTCYPDGARGGQPLTKVPLQEAIDFGKYEYEEIGNGQACVSGVCGA